jgi:hypothetical protein
MAKTPDGPFLEVVKVQIPIMSTEAEPMILVYNEDRSRQCFIPATDHYKRLFLYELKSFWVAEWNPEKQGYDKFMGPTNWHAW